MASGRILLRMLLRNLRKRGLNTRRFAICGVNKLGVQLAQNILDSPELGLEFVGFFDDRPESRTVEIPIRSDAFSMWDRDMKRVTEPGEFTVMVGPNSQDLKSVKLTVAQ